MGRPKQDLNKWCNTDIDFKFEFLDQECKKPDGLIKYLNNPQGLTLISELKFFNPKTPQDVTFTYQQAILANGLCIQVSLECFNQLKKQFIKYKKEKTKRHLVKKQYHFEKELSNRIQYIKKKNGWAKEETVIEHVINSYINLNTYKKSKAEVDTKTIKLQVLNEEINKNLLEIQQLKTEVFELKQKLSKETSAKEHYENLCKEHGIDGENSQLTETSPS
ncbi:hypothetical protein [Acinetobacter gerneri]|uniref:Uncharacterized protein n=1 Tax=Acinetobacter gerneri DSM 14967 = CIP 107464 = MTCC 9824 TaxID=1120926 RepID=N8ZP35_9GAMM|nr:hypothetical protein [Acinetobacter gerneri]ENV33280.1 hypothetical protein F960_02307 [Acinetobacter gerneri DSM 14967 = CIP 107464 = MTCC 9824]EPR81330.1 hypothetical protein L289_3822 [Acinetobacter gerneri DSM 14967 = CIP 107464 = MTCC 9824]